VWSRKASKKKKKKRRTFGMPIDRRWYSKKRKGDDGSEMDDETWRCGRWGKREGRKRKRTGRQQKPGGEMERDGPRMEKQDM
jgi:hypothetical protein